MKATYKRNNLLAVREAPSKEAKILDTMTPGESAEVESVSDGWCKTPDGYIMSSLVELEEDEPAGSEDTMTPGESAEVDYTAMKAAELRDRKSVV